MSIHRRPHLRRVVVTLLADVVETSAQVAATSSRSAKIAALAALLCRVDAGEVAICVGFLSGAPRQGRVGVGYAIVYEVETAAVAQPTLTVKELDQAIEEIALTTGSGSGQRRRE